MQSVDGKFYLTDVAETEQLFRLIQSVPSPKAEPFKVWLARVGYERMQEIESPELAAQRTRELYKLIQKAKQPKRDFISKSNFNFISSNICLFYIGNLFIRLAFSAYFYNLLCIN